MKSDGHTCGIAICLLAVSISLQGCIMMGNDLPHIEGYVPIMPGSDMAIHKVAKWRQKTDSYITHSFKDPATGKVRFNSCMDKHISAQNVCNSHGICAPFERTNIVSPTFFCRCDSGWAGSECTIKQKSQLVAWLLSMSLGFVGADQYYLETTLPLILKVLGFFIGSMVSALGWRHVGLTIVMSYWFYDIVRIGSSPVHARHAKVAADLPHWAFAVFTLLFFAFLGLSMGVCKVYWRIKEKRRRYDVSTNYCACDGFGAPLDVKIMKPYDHYHVFGFPIKNPVPTGPSWSSLPEHVPPP